MIKKLLVLLTLTSLATACRKDKEQPTIDFGPNGGFTTFDNTALPAGQTDPTDWTSDGSWNETEQQLFAGLNLSLSGPQLPAKTYDIFSYPNPSSVTHGRPATSVQFRGSTPPAATIRLSIVVVDSHYQVLETNDFDASRGWAMFTYNPNNSRFTANALYRLYYVLYTPGQQVHYRGHGDLKFVD
jgi:hypothetical protein